MMNSKTSPVVAGMLLMATPLLAQADDATARTPQQVEQLVDSVLNNMTQEEKIDYIHVGDGHLLPPVDRFGLPGTNSVDSTMGIRVKATKKIYGTSFPSQTAAAATWNINRIKELGLALGYEARMSGAEHFLSPVVNLVRTPLGGRNAESICGEDPFFCSVMAPTLTNAVQRQGVTSTVKHWLANEQEANRHNLDVIVAARPMRELYMPPFESLVKNADVAAVMCGFNKINGEYACGNHFLITDVLKGEWGFKGFVSSDFNSIKNTFNAAWAGTDMDQPSGYYFTWNKLTELLESGQLTQNVIDNKVRRNLRTLFRYGFDQQVYEAQSLEHPEYGEQASIDVAREGIVLLKNRGASQGAGGLLPLDKNAKIAVVGDLAQQAPTSPYGTPYSIPLSNYVTELNGLKQLANNSDNIDFIQTMALNAHDSVWYQPDCTRNDDNCTVGVKAEYFDNTQLAGEPVLTRTETGVNLDWENMANNTANGDRVIDDINPSIGGFSARISGKLRPTTDGRQVIKVRADGPFKLYLDGEQIMQFNGEGVATDLKVAIPKSVKTKRLYAGQLYNVTLEYSREQSFTYRYGGWLGIQMSWASLEPPKNLADYDAVIAVVGRNYETEGETMDHGFKLPNREGYMLKQLTKANPNTVVVMHGGGAMAMLPWANNAGAILHAWYTGQFGGQALAEILYGDVNPSGKLPISLDKRFKFNPSYASYSNLDDYIGDNAKTTMEYSEGIYMGYRGYQVSNHQPLYPFGFGLSYTDFSFSDLKLSNRNISRDGIINARFTVTNTGGRAGYEVAQVYVQPTNSPIDRPDHELKGFAKVYLEAGESKQVTIPLNARSFSYYDQASNSWVIPEGGQFNVLVGSDEATLPLQNSVTAPEAISVGTFYSNPLPTPVAEAVKVSANDAY